MALVNCKECNSKISSSAKSCPQCGKEISANQEYGCGTIIVIAIVAMIALKVCSPSDSAREDHPKTTAELRKDTIGQAFSAWDGSHINLESYIKKRLKDPDSYQHIETKYRDDGETIFVTTKYRAKNSFGGYVVESVSATAKINGEIIEVH